MSCDDTVADVATPTSTVVQKILESNLSEGGDTDTKNASGTSDKLRWQIGPCIGKGAFAEVYQGIDTVTGKFLAVKQIKLKDEASAAAKALQREIDVMTQLPHHRSFPSPVCPVEYRCVTTICLAEACVVFNWEAGTLSSTWAQSTPMIGYSFFLSTSVAVA